MDPVVISKATARRFVLGRQGLWPGRRWSGKEGTAQALRAVEAVQMDPLNVVARSHDLVLWSRVIDYRPEYLDKLLYQDRGFFDYGGALFIYPMTELPFWRLSMRRTTQWKRWASFAVDHADVIEHVRDALRNRGPLGNRDLAGTARVRSYRGRKDTALALYYLWLTGEVMVHHRKGFERVYDFRERVVPPELDYAAPDDEAEAYFSRKAVAFLGRVRESTWRHGFYGYTDLRLDRDEAGRRIEALLDQGVLARVRVEDDKEMRLVLASDVAHLDTLEAGQVPDGWQPLDTTTEQEAVFLAPLDIVSARGRAAWLFDFDYIWEVYKPASNRRWGYYTLPILYSDRLVARLDLKLDRNQATLLVNGFWLEDRAPAADPTFAAALARAFIRLGTFLGAQRLGGEGLANMQPPALRARVCEAVRPAMDVQIEIGGGSRE